MPFFHEIFMDIDNITIINYIVINKKIEYVYI